METKTPQTILPEGYYLDNQERVLRFVIEAHAPLLAPHERRRAEDFLRLSLPARRLYTRLYTRRGPLFLLSSLSYSEIPSLEEATMELARAGFAALLSTPCDAAEAAMLFALFTKEQLLPIVKRRFGSMVNKLKKEQLLQALLDHPDDWTHLSQERFVIVLDEHIFSLFEVLFFGNRHQSLTDFILVDIARIKYYPYPITSAPIFSSRAALAQYLQSAQLLQRASELTTKEEATLLIEMILPSLAASQPLPAHQRMVDPRRYWQRAAFLAARECERHEESSLARGAYEALSTIDADPHTQAESIDRFGLLCKRENDVAAFERLCQSATTRGSLDALSMFQLETRRAKLALGGDPKRSLREAPVVSFTLTPTGHQGAKATYRGEQSDSLSVELATLELLGGDGLWSENGLWLTLFGVLCWEVIFAPIPGVFVQPFQAGPQDLWSDSFYERRGPLFEETFQRLEADVLAVLMQNHQKYAGYACHFTLWEEFPLSLLRRVAEGLGPKLLTILRRIAQSPGRHSNGLPDLVVFDAEGLSLVEVKGPGDTLRLAQRLWHDHLLKSGVRVKLAKIVAPKAPPSTK